LLSSLWDRRITHGDLKLQNILLGSETATLIDIDQIQVHLNERLFRSAQKKDLARLRHFLLPFDRSESFLAGLQGGMFQFEPDAG
jgi:serine/threonine-protein kinase RIO1